MRVPSLSTYFCLTLAEPAKPSALSQHIKSKKIEITHSFADFVFGAYELIKDGVLKSRVLNAVETPHRMLEGNEKNPGICGDFQLLSCVTWSAMTRPVRQILVVNSSLLFL